MIDRRPTIGIDASRLSVGQRTGTETYTAELLAAMAALDPLETFRLYLNAHRPPPDLHPLGEPRCIPLPRLWTHARLSLEMVRHRPDVLFVPAHVVPVIHPKSVVTIHDLGYLHEPDAHPLGQRRMLDLTTRWSARSATRIVAVSESTKGDLIDRYGVLPSKIDVIPHGVSDAFQPSGPADMDRIRDAYQLPDRFVLAVGTIQPRKNLSTLANALAGVSDLPLVIAGKPGWLADQVMADLVDPIKAGRVRMLGYVPDGDLPALYGAASCVAFVSRFEGFGLPAIEAMACGTPVVASDRGALPEVVGVAGLIVDADDPGQIAVAIRSIVDDPVLHARLRGAGLNRATLYTWRATAEATLRVLREVAEG